MRKIQKAAVVAAILGSIGFVGAGTASASGGYGHSDDNGDVSISQHTSCVSHDLNVDVLGNVGVANGVLGNLAGGEGNPGAQGTDQGSEQGCNEHVG